MKLSLTIDDITCILSVKLIRKNVFGSVEYETGHSISYKHACIMLTPLNPTLYSKTGVYRGIHYFSFFCSKNIDCGYSLEPPRRGGSNEYPQSARRF